MKRFSSLLLLLLSLLAFFASCRKDKENTQSPQAEPVLLIRFEGTYLQKSQADSALLQWKEGDQLHQLKFIQRNDSLFLPQKNLPAGEREWEILVFAQKRYANQYQGIWSTRKTLNLQGKQTVTVSAPASFTDPAWKPRVHLNDAVGHDAIIALRPDDPYFLISPTNHPTLRYVLERTYWNTVGGPRAVATRTWECSNNCVSQANETYFTDFVQRIGNQPWNHISLVVVFETDPNGLAWILNLEWEP